MGKKIKNKRFLSAPAPDKKAKVSYKRSVQTARDIHHYEEGKGSTGISIRKPRLVKRIRKILNVIKPKEDGKRNSVIYKNYIEKITGAMDGYSNCVMKCAAEIAEARNTKNAKGVKIRVSDLELAGRWIYRMSNQ
jgi:hypothetical protein